MGDESGTAWTATDKDRRNQRLVVAWSLAWASTFLAATYGIEADRIGSDALALLATIGVAVVGLGTLLVFRRFLRDADELMRKIQLDALAIAVGVGLVAGFSLSLIERSEIVDQSDVMTVVLVMILSYIVSVVAGLGKYR